MTPLPHLQFAVLGVLSATSMAGRELRDELAKLGVKKQGPAFYRLMARLEESGLVRGWYEQEVVAGQVLRERRYEATVRGRTARDETADFHRRVMRGFSGEEGALA